MTHIFDTSTDEYNQILTGEKVVDILNFGRSVSLGDIIIYQRLADTENEEKNGEINDTAFTDDEISVRINFIYDDTEKVIKKGFTAVTFKEKE